MSKPPTTDQGSALGRIAVRITVWTSLGTYLNQGIGFAATLIMTRLLDPSTFGIFALATFWYTLLSLRPKAGINYSAIRQADSNGKLLGTYWGLDAALAIASLVLSLVVGLVLLWLNTTLPQASYSPVMVAALAVLMLVDTASVIVSPLSMILEKELQVSRLTLVALVAAIIAYSVAILMALGGAGIGDLLAVNVVTMLVSVIGVYFVCRQRLPHVFNWKWRFDRGLARRLLREGLPTGLSLTALGSIVTQFDNFLIGTFVGVATLGYYDRAYRIAHWPNLLLTVVVSRIGFLTFSKVQNDLPRLTHAVRLSFWVLTTLGIPIGLWLLFGAPDIVRILYGPQWGESAVFLRFLTIYSFLWPLVNVGFWLSVAKAHTRTMMVITMSQAAMLIVLGTPLTIQWGAIGTIAAVIATMILAFTLSSIYVFRQVDLSFIETYSAPVIAMICALFVLVFVTQATALNTVGPFLRLAVIGVLGPGVFWLSLFLLRPKETVERVQYLRRVWRKN